METLSVYLFDNFLTLKMQLICCWIFKSKLRIQLSHHFIFFLVIYYLFTRLEFATSKLLAKCVCVCARTQRMRVCLHKMQFKWWIQGNCNKVQIVYWEIHWAIYTLPWIYTHSLKFTTTFNLRILITCFTQLKPNKKSAFFGVSNLVDYKLSQFKGEIDSKPRGMFP